ncbi:MAG: zinc ribbon domain-containing protein [Leptolyngbya sp.]|nr:zinc ribbon domain-containing protein [Candidatus Melainabacteria bacterium]
MAVYDYRCKDCRVTFTIERPMTADSTDCACSDCGSKEVTRIWNAFIRSGGSTPDVGQNSKSEKTSGGGGGCGSCSTHSCSSC